MKIAILSAANVSGWYGATLMQRGHEITFGPFGYLPGAVASMISDGTMTIRKRLPHVSLARPAVPYGEI
jgi:hypothetical protein